MGDTFDKCFHMTDLVPTTELFGPAARMPYLLSGHWRDTTLLKVLAIALTVYVNLTFLITLVLYFFQKYKRNMKQTYTNTLVLLFNFSNAFIFSILVNIGWVGNTFVVAAVHNAIEAMFILVLYKKFFKKLVGNTEVSYDLLMNVAVGAGFLTVVPHLLIVDFKINAYIKAIGGISDVSLFLASSAGLVKYAIDTYRRKYKRASVIKAERRHVILLMNTLSHTGTVMLTFVTCFHTNTQLSIIVIGTAAMNTFGTLYFFFQINDKMYSKKFKPQRARSNTNSSISPITTPTTETAAKAAVVVAPSKSDSSTSSPVNPADASDELKTSTKATNTASSNDSSDDVATPTTPKKKGKY